MARFKILRGVRQGHNIVAIIHTDVSKRFPGGTPDPNYVIRREWDSTPPRGMTAAQWRAQILDQIKGLAKVHNDELDVMPDALQGIEGDAV